MTEEVWREIPGADGAYEASSHGHVRSTDRIIERTYGGEVRRVRRSGKVLKPWPDTNGYLNIYVCKNGARLVRGVHRLVASAFLGPPPLGCSDVNHIDGVKQNNAPENLEWCTRKANMEHARAAGLLSIKPVEGVPARGGDVVRFASAKEAAAAIGTSEKAIHSAAHGSRPTAGGYCWRYEGEEWRELPPNFIHRKPRSPKYRPPDLAA